MAQAETILPGRALSFHNRPRLFLCSEPTSATSLQSQGL